MPILESMSIGVPVVATACGSMPELLGDGRVFLMETEYSMIEPWGNSRRDFPSADSGMNILNSISIDKLIDVPEHHKPSINKTERAREYMETRTWDKAIQHLVNAVENIKDV